jgi:hypothetical protein
VRVRVRVRVRARVRVRVRVCVRARAWVCVRVRAVHPCPTLPDAVLQPLSTRPLCAKRPRCSTYSVYKPWSPAVRKMSWPSSAGFLLPDTGASRKRPPAATIASCGPEQGLTPPRSGQCTCVHACAYIRARTHACAPVRAVYSPAPLHARIRGTWRTPIFWEHASSTVLQST